MISPRILQIFVCCQALAEGLKHNSTLTNLALNHNNIGPAGAQAWCLVRMVRILRNPSWGGGGKALWIQTELVEGEMVKWVRGRLHDWCWDVPSPSCRSEWIWACSCHFIGDHMICGYERKYEKNAVEGVEISFMWISMNLRWFHHVFCRSLSAVRHWQRDWSTTRPWQTWLCFATTLVLPGLRLGVWWGCWGLSRIGHEGGEERHYGSRQS